MMKKIHKHLSLRTFELKNSTVVHVHFEITKDKKYDYHSTV